MSPFQSGLRIWPVMGMNLTLDSAPAEGGAHMTALMHSMLLSNVQVSEVKI